MKNPDRINQELFEKIKRKLGKGKTVAYKKIAEVADAYNVPRGIAAIKLASTLRINISKYSNHDYYQYIQGGPTPGGVALPSMPNGSPYKPKSKPIQKQLKLDLSKITNPDLEAIISRDVAELNTAITSGVEKTSKTCIILSGSIAEALILERLTRTRQILNASIKVANQLRQDRPRNPNDPFTWALGSLVAVAQQIPDPVLPADSLPQIGQLRKWRNLVHPGNEIKETSANRVQPTAHRARNAIGFLDFVAHELSR